MRHFVSIIATGLAWYALSTPGMLCWRYCGLPGQFWLPSGLGLAAVVLFGPRAAVGVAAAALVAALTRLPSVWFAVISAAGCALPPLLGAWALERGSFQRQLGRGRDVLLLMMVAGLACAPLGAVLGGLALCLAGLEPWWRLPELLLTHWLGLFMGIMLVGSTILVWWPGGAVKPLRGWNLGEALLLLLLVWASGALLYSGLLGGEWAEMLVFTIVPLAVWAAIRFGQAGATVTCLLTGVMAVGATVSGLGPFNGGDMTMGLLRLYGLLSSLVVTALLVAALETERRSHQAALRAANLELAQRVERRTEQLQQAAAEVKTLSGLLPICSGCKKIRDDHGQWTEIESYIADRSEADFSHGLCPDCVRRLYPELRKDQAP